MLGSLGYLNQVALVSVCVPNFSSLAGLEGDRLISSG